VLRLNKRKDNDKVYIAGSIGIMFLAIGGAGLLMGITDTFIIYPYRNTLFVSPLYNLAILEIVGGIIFLIVGLVFIKKAKELLSKETLSSSTKQKIFCFNCENKLDADAIFCPKCGTKVE